MAWHRSSVFSFVRSIRQDATVAVFRNEHLEELATIGVALTLDPLLQLGKVDVACMRYCGLLSSVFSSAEAAEAEYGGMGVGISFLQCTYSSE